MDVRKQRLKAAIRKVAAMPDNSADYWKKPADMLETGARLARGERLDAARDFGHQLPERHKAGLQYDSLTTDLTVDTEQPWGAGGDDFGSRLKGLLAQRRDLYKGKFLDPDNTSYEHTTDYDPTAMGYGATALGGAGIGATIGGLGWGREGALWGGAGGAVLLPLALLAAKKGGFLRNSTKHTLGEPKK